MTCTCDSSIVKMMHYGSRPHPPVGLEKVLFWTYFCWWRLQWEQTKLWGCWVGWLIPMPTSSTSCTNHVLVVWENAGLDTLIYSWCYCKIHCKWNSYIWEAAMSIPLCLKICCFSRSVAVCLPRVHVLMVHDVIFLSFLQVLTSPQ